MNERSSSGRSEVVAIASRMLAGRINLIEGTRCICALRFGTEDPDNKVFLTFRAIESETDTYPLGAVRSNCSEDYLRRADAEMDVYLQDARAHILQACREVIAAFS